MAEREIDSLLYIL